MPKPTVTTLELFARALRRLLLGVFAVFVGTSVLTSVLVAASSLPLATVTPLANLTGTAHAATSSTLNFQARLENANGGIVPDGYYNVEFKLYNASASSGSAQGSCTGDAACQWTETDKYFSSGACNYSGSTGDCRLRVVNGYVTVNLGANNPFPGINWNQQLWLTMRIGGNTTTPSWDSEMSPRIQLTAVPYAFQAGALGNGSNTASLDSSGNLNLSAGGATISTSMANGGITLQGNGSGTLNLGGSTATNTINIGVSAGSGNTQTINIGTSGTAGSTTNLVLGSTIAGTTTLQSAGGVVVSTLGTANTVAYLCRNASNIIATCQTTATGSAFVQGGNSFGAQAVLGTNDGNALAFETSGVTRLTLDSVSSTLYAPAAASGTQLILEGGPATSGTNVGGRIVLEGGAGASTGASGSVVVLSNTNNSTAAFQVQNASSVAVLSVDTANAFVGINATSDPNGGWAQFYDASTARFDNDLRLQKAAGTAYIVRCNSSCAGTSGYDLVLKATNADQLTLQGGGGIIVNNAANSANYFQVKSVSLGSAFYVDGNSGQVGIGTNTPSADITLGNNASKTINVLAATTGTQLTIQAGAANSGTNVGGNLVLQGGAGASTGASGSVIVKSNTNNSTAAFEVQNAAATTTVFNVDTSNDTVTLHSGNDQLTLGSELYSGNFSAGWTTTNWTLGGGSTTASHTSGNTSALANTNVPITSGATYQVSFALSGTCTVAADTVTVSIGGTNLATIDGTNCSGAVYTYVGTAGNTNGLTFTPTTSWGGTISAISIKQLTGSINPTFAIQNASGVANVQVRASSNTSNIYIGLSSGGNNTSSGINNTALGSSALSSNDSGNGNVAVGTSALKLNTTGYNNTGVGSFALQLNSTGIANTAVGAVALNVNTTGTSNTAIGTYAL